LAASDNETMLDEPPPYGLRYPLVGETRERHFAGTSLKPCKVPENAQTPTNRVHALLGVFVVSRTHQPKTMRPKKHY